MTGTETSNQVYKEKTKNKIITIFAQPWKFNVINKTKATHSLYITVMSHEHLEVSNNQKFVPLLSLQFHFQPGSAYMVMFSRSTLKVISWLREGLYIVMAWLCFAVQNDTATEPFFFFFFFFFLHFLAINSRYIHDYWSLTELRVWDTDSMILVWC